MLLPTMLPTAMSPCRRRTGMTEVTSSGKQVPTATTVNPITASEIPAAAANPTSRRQIPMPGTLRSAWTGTQYGG